MKDDLTKDEKIQFLNSLIGVLADIGYGRGQGFGGLEGVAVSLAGRGLKNPIGEQLDKIADAINNHTESMNNIACAIECLSEKLSEN